MTACKILLFMVLEIHVFFCCALKLDTCLTYENAHILCQRKGYQ